MGYYSDVGLCLTAAGKFALDAALTEAEKDNPDVTDIKNMLDSAEIRTDTDSGTVAYLWERRNGTTIFPKCGSLKTCCWNCVVPTFCSFG